MQRSVIIAIVLIAAGLAGCTSGPPRAHQTDYDDLPGTRDMASGPGLLSGKHYDRSNGGGTLLYSDDKPDQSVFGSAQRADDTAAAKPARSPDRQESPAEKSAVPSGQAAEFSDFRQFQAYERFQKLPEDSAEKQRFEQWQKWQQYKRWENRQQQ